MESAESHAIIAHQFADDLGSWVTLHLKKRAVAAEIAAFELAHPDIVQFVDGVKDGDIEKVVDAGFTIV